MIVRVHGGLCNRLRSVLSFRAAGYAHIDVAWAPDSQVGGGRFEDAFEPLTGVSFHDDLPVTGCGGDVTTNEPSPQAQYGWRVTYRDLRLKGSLLERLPTGEYDAIHVRRTDHVPYAKSLGNPTPDAEFIEWCAKSPEGRPVYVATDNRTSQVAMCGALLSIGHFPIVAEPIAANPDENRHDHRNTGIEHAAIDLFACAGAQRFKGTRESSFSDTVDLLRFVRIE